MWINFLAAISLVLTLQFLISWRSSKLSVDELSSGSHLPRRAQHACSGLAILGVYESELLSRSQCVGTLLCCSFVYFTIHRARLSYPGLNRLLVQQFANILRKEETVNVVPAAFWFLLGCAFSILLFPRTVCCLALVHVSIGDPAAGLVGTYFRSPRYVKGKTLAGTAGAFLFSAMGSLIFLSSRGDSDMAATALLPVSLLAGITAAVAEGWNILGLNDNLTMPLVSGTLLLLASEIFPLHGL